VVAELAAQDLSQRLNQLEQRVAGLEARNPAGERPAGKRAQSRSATDPERFWALEGLKSRTSDGSAVLFTGSVTLPTDTKYEWQQQFGVDALMDAEWSLASDVLAALGHPVRLMILREILGGIDTVADLGTVEGFGTTGQLYHHLRQLVAAGWLQSGGRGRYEVPAVRVVALLVVLAVAQR